MVVKNYFHFTDLKNMNIVLKSCGCKHNLFLSSFISKFLLNLHISAQIGKN